VLPPTEVFTSTQGVVDGIGRLAELGVTWTTFSRPGSPPTSLSEYLEGIQWAGEEVLPFCRSNDGGGA